MLRRTRIHATNSNHVETEEHQLEHDETDRDKLFHAIRLCDKYALTWHLNTPKEME